MLQGAAIARLALAELLAKVYLGALTAAKRRAHQLLECSTIQTESRDSTVAEVNRLGVHSRMALSELRPARPL